MLKKAAASVEAQPLVTTRVTVETLLRAAFLECPIHSRTAREAQVNKKGLFDESCGDISTLAYMSCPAIVFARRITLLASSQSAGLELSATLLGVSIGGSIAIAVTNHHSLRSGIQT